MLVLKVLVYEIIPIFILAWQNKFLLQIKDINYRNKNLREVKPAAN